MTRTPEQIAEAAKRLDEHLARLDAGEAEPGRMVRPSPQLASLGHASVARDQARTAVDLADRAVEEAVTAARRAGHSWAEIAVALGVKRQSAHKRYSHLDRVARVR